MNDNAMAANEKEKEKEPSTGDKSHISFHTAGLVAELYPSHTQKQKKLGPIGRKKLQQHHEDKKKLSGGDVRKRRSHGLLKTYQDNDNHGGKTGHYNGGSETTDKEAEALSDTTDVTSVAESNSVLDGITGIPMEALWFGKNKKTLEGNALGNIGISDTMMQAARRIRLLSTVQAPQLDINDLDEDGMSSLHVATQHNKVALIEDLVMKGADINLRSTFDGATPLHIASKYNCANAAKLLLKYDADVTAKLTNGQTPNHICCRKNHMDIVQLIVNKRPGCVNGRDNDMTTPLHQAAMNGDVNLCSYLVDHGAQIRAKDINDVTPLIQAAQSGFKDIVQYLLTAASQLGIFLCDYIIDVDNEGNTALHLAVSNRHIHVARALIDRGAPTDCRRPNGFTPLHQAAIFGEVGMVEMLIDRGAETEVLDNEQMTPLHRAALYNRVEVILLLIRQGLFLDSRDEDNFTPLLCASWKGQADAGRTLLRYGASIQALDKETKSCLHWAVEMQHFEFVEMLFEHGHGGDEIIDWCDREDQTALHYAAEVGRVKLTKLLIQHSAKVHVRDVNEKSPLHIAAGSGHLDCVKVLLEACPLPLNDDDIDDMTPLLLASENGHLPIVKYLIRMGADMTKRNDDRRSPLALAGIQNEVAVMTVLLNNNADVNSCDKDKNTSLHLCAQAGHPAPATLLINCGANLSAQNIHGQYPLDVAIEYKHEAVAMAIVSSRYWETALNNHDEHNQSPLQRLIQYVPDAAMKVLDQCVIRSHTDQYHPDMKVTYDFKYVDPGPDDPSSMKGDRYFALETMVENSREKLLAHELSQSVLAKKWSKFAGWFNSFDTLFYTSFLVVLVIYLEIAHSLMILTQSDKFGCPVDNSTNHTVIIGSKQTDEVDTWESSVSWEDVEPKRIVDLRVTGCEIFLMIFVTLKLCEDIGEFYWARFSYFQNFENWMHIYLFISIMAFVWPPYYPPCNINWAFGALGVFIAWMNFIFVLQRYDFFGLYVTMFYTTLKSLLKAMVVYSFFIIGFALSFFICFNNTSLSFRNEWTSILTTFTMTLGEINKADLLDSGQSLEPFEEIANIVFVVFLFLMPMVLINLTIGISVGDIDSILQKSYIERYSIQVKMIFGLEKRFPKFIQRKVWQPNYSFYPNRQKPTLWRKIKLLLIGSGREEKKAFLGDSKEQSTTIEDLMTGFHRHEQTLSDLSTVINRQSEILRRLAEKNDIQLDV